MQLVIYSVYCQRKPEIMNPIYYDLLLGALSALVSWFITHRYYVKSLKVQDLENSRERAVLVEALEEQNATDSALLMQSYIDAAVEAWRKEGTAVHYINSLELPNEEKANIFRAANLRHKKREPKRNPYVCRM